MPILFPLPYPIRNLSSSLKKLLTGLLKEVRLPTPETTDLILQTPGFRKRALVPVEETPTDAVFTAYGLTRQGNRSKTGLVPRGRLTSCLLVLLS